MSLPKVSYGTYNYGQYANPTAIKYKGGFGEGLAAAIGTAGKTFGEIKAAQVKKTDAANAEATISSQKYGAAIKEYLGNATAQNKKYIKQKKKEYGDVVRQYRLKQISDDEYTEAMDGFENLLVSLKGLRGAIDTAQKVNNGEDIPMNNLRGDALSIDAEIKRRALDNGKFILSDNAQGEPQVQMPAFIGLNQGQFPVQNVLLNDLNSNEKIYMPDLDYRHDDNQNIKNVKKDIRQKIVESDNLTIFRETADEAGEMTLRAEYVDGSKKNEIIDLIKEDGQLVGKLTADQQRIYFEDQMKNGIGSWNGSEDQVGQLENALAEDLVNDFLGPDGKGIILGNKTNKPKENDPRGTLTERDRATILKRIKDTEPQRNDIVKNYNSLITYNSKDGLTDYAKLETRLLQLGIQPAGLLEDSNEKIVGFTAQGPYGQSFNFNFKTMTPQTMGVLLENLQGGIKANQLADPANYLP